MRIETKKFGDVLVSRQAGREAYGAFLPIINNVAANEEVVVNLEGINVLSPSWADEFLTPLLERFDKRLKLTQSQNPSVRLTIQTLEAVLGKKFLVEKS